MYRSPAHLREEVGDAAALRIGGLERNDDIDVPRHPWLRIEAHRYGTADHVSDPRCVEPGRNQFEDVQLVA